MKLTIRCGFIAVLMIATTAFADLSYAGECDKPGYDRTLDEKFSEENGNRKVTPYTCSSYKSFEEVEIEHIVAWAEARKSGLSCSRAKDFINATLNIAVALPAVNQDKWTKDAAQWMPEYNKCWFANRVKKVKEKYGLSMDIAEHSKIEGTLSRCSDEDKNNWKCRQR